jgi:diguanylate cyclase (GGDEF)-like protein
MVASRRLRASEAAALALAHTDPVSDLPNRRAFSTILGERLDAWRDGTGTRPMLACLDLDRFKNVNDTLGHEAGDRLVLAVADRLRAALDDDKLLARLGGDEFAVIAPCHDADAPQRLADELTALFREPFDITGHHVGITASIGITIAGQGNNSPVMMARYADIALYEAKASRGSTQIFRPEMSHAVERRHSLETELETVIRTGEGLRLVYQPVVPFARGSAHPGVEALLRWTRADGEVVAPDELIPIAEASGQMERLGSWVIDRAFRDAAAWPDMEVSINLSPTQFRASGLIRYLEGKSRTLGVSPGRIILEVTESLVIETRWNVEQVLHDLRAAGFRIALDDFGTGYSSLSYLRRFPFDRLKLDRALVHGVTEDPTAMAIVETAAALGRRLGLDVVAEGIETQDDADLMLVAGCTHLQGYLISRPIEACDMPRYAALARESISQAAG